MKTQNTSIARLIGVLMIFVNMVNQVNAGNIFKTHTLFTETANNFYVRFLNKSENGLPPQNGKIVYEEGNSSNAISRELYTMNGDGSNKVRLTNNNVYDGDPFFSPNGKKILFNSNRDVGNAQIYVMNEDGTNIIRLTNNALNDNRPAFSPNSAKIVFSRVIPNNVNSSEIYIMNSDGSSQVQLTNNSSADEFPKWSPDGSKIIFNSTRDGGDRDIFVMNIDGSNVIQLTTNNDAEDAEASFSPDGTKILFFSRPIDSSNSEVYVMNSDGSNKVNVSNNPSSDGSCSWSPDGQQITFVSGRDGNTEVYTMNANGSGQTRLTNNNLLNNTPIWGVAITTSSEASISGQILTYEGNPISRAQVRLTDSDGNRVTATSNSFGYYQFDDVPVGETYVITAIARDYSFTPQIINLSGDLTGLNLIANQ